MANTNNNDDFFNILFEGATVGKIIIDISGKILKLNKAFCKIVGYQTDELINNLEEDIIIDNSQIQNRVEINNLISSNYDSVQYQCKYKLKQGGEIDTMIDAELLYNKNSEPICIVKQVTKSEAKKQKKTSIISDEFIMTKIMDEMPANIYFKDLESKYTFVNQSMAADYGESDPQALIGKSDFDYYDKESAEVSWNNDQNILKTGEIFEEMVQESWADGKTTWAHTAKRPLHDEEGNLIGVFGISSDVTGSKKAEEELEEAHEEVSRKNKELKATLISLKEAQSSLVNAEKLAALGQLIAGIAHEVNTPLGAINASNSNIRSSFSMLIENIETNISNFNQNEIDLLKYVIDNYEKGSAEVLTSKERRAIKKDISQKLAMQGNGNSSKIADILIYTNQHNSFDRIVESPKDVNLILVLNAAKNMISIIKNGENISTAINKASNVVLALKKYIHKTHDGSKSKTDIIDNIETVLTLNQNKLKQGVDIVKNYDTIPLIDAFPDEISQVWNNLITNSIHAMNNRGTITIDIINNSDNLIIKFTDTGCGISDEIKDKIFTPFFTTKISGEGTGLGLDIIKRIVEKHCGKITLETEVNKGTTFAVQLPFDCSK